MIHRSYVRRGADSVPVGARGPLPATGEPMDIVRQLTISWSHESACARLVRHSDFYLR